ncbi:MAG TPA: toll/interleukin-1 receptor domain-containing protein [Actinophytocola sp.]|uniref:toll/interleukin-1 receptor domain-containing protein n=1 Tax=Actinophytocola sp. TaxID=1872138 RepID=UPI002DB690E9|nr:toll/interleukin-1 receptor domain-containing protein [Actinophytocola sp.]HEU5476193.1 toll/interleukin-1 receptor domain-containing protein [Actinophytocola sp.]
MPDGGRSACGFRCWVGRSGRSQCVGPGYRTQRQGLRAEALGHAGHLQCADSGQGMDTAHGRPPCRFGVGHTPGVTEIAPVGPRIFLSYAHDSDAHRSAVAALAGFLETRGVTVVFDLWHDGGRRDWYAWVLQEIQAADFVIVVASPRYREFGEGNGSSGVHRGVQAETAALRELLYRDRRTWLGRVLPVVLPGGSLDELPTFVQPYSGSHFVLRSIDEPGAEHLLRVLTGQPRHARPARGRVPALPNGAEAAPITPDGSTSANEQRRKPVSDWTWRLRIPSPRLTDLVVLPAAGFGVAVLAVWLLTGLSWLTTAAILATSLGVLAAVRRYGQQRFSVMWQVVCLAAVPLLVGVLVTLPAGRAPALSTTAEEPTRTGHGDRSTTDRSLEDTSSGSGTLPDRPQPGSPTTSAGPTSAPQGTHSSTASAGDGAHQGSPQPGPPLQILDVGHAFTPETDRIRISIRNNGLNSVLVKEIGIYLDFYPGNHWSDGDDWNFVMTSQMYAGDPAFDGSRRTHGTIQMTGTEFNLLLIGRGFVRFNGSWRRLLTFDPQKFLAGATSSTIVIDLPLTHLVQQTSPSQPAGPMIEQKFDPNHGSLLTRIDVRTPDNQTFKCHYLSRAENNPTCDTINPAAAVELPR